MALASTETYRQNPRGVTDADGREVVVTGIGDTVYSSNSVLSPAAPIAIASVSGLLKGVYSVETTVVMTGTAETNLRNIQLKSNFNSIGYLLTISGAGAIFTRFPRLSYDPAQGGGAPFELVVPVAVVAGAIYSVQLAVTRIG